MMEKWMIEKEISNLLQNPNRVFELLTTDKELQEQYVKEVNYYMKKKRKRFFGRKKLYTDEIIFIIISTMVNYQILKLSGGKTFIDNKVKVNENDIAQAVLGLEEIFKKEGVIKA